MSDSCFDHKVESIISNAMMQVICDSPDIDFLLDSVVRLLVDNNLAAWGASIAHWYNALSVSSQPPVYVAGQGWQQQYQRCHEQCNTLEAQGGPHSEQNVRFLEKPRLLVIKLQVKAYPEHWLLFELSANNTPGLACMSRWTKWLQYAIDQQQKDRLLEQSQARIEEMSRGMAETMAQLVQAEKMSELGKLTAGIAHEINNPIGYIRSNLESMTVYTASFRDIFAQLSQLEQEVGELRVPLQALQKQYDIQFLLEDCEDIVQTNIKGIDRISGIVSDLYAFSRRADGTFKAMDIHPVLQRCINLTRSRFADHHTVELDVSAVDTRLRGDASQLEQVLMNLMLNAAHAMPGVGTLTIAVKGDALWLEISLTDTGTGMPKATLNRIFTPFFTTKPTGQGTGLGLSISQGIIRAHGGTIVATSDVGKGTTFTLRLPRQQDGSQ